MVRLGLEREDMTLPATTSTALSRWLTRHGETLSPDLKSKAQAARLSLDLLAGQPKSPVMEAKARADLREFVDAWEAAPDAASNSWR